MSLTEAAARIKQTWKDFADKAIKPNACPFCGHTRLWWDGCRTRSASVRTEHGTVHLTDIPCRRVTCAAPSCRKSWTLRPPGLVPHKHYQLDVVASAVSAYLFRPNTSQAGIAQEHDCSERTVGRWLWWVSQIADPSILARKVLATVGSPVMTPMRTVENLARKARQTIRQGILPRSAQVLSALEILGTAMGLEPPGLRGVLDATLAGRSRLATYRRPIISEFAR